MNFNRFNVQELLQEGSRHYYGTDVLLRNIEAVNAIAEMTRTSMGPNGMNKMVVNHLDKLFVTHDAATIMREVDIVHPAAKIVVLAAQAQEKEVGDGTNLVLSLSGSLMSHAEGLLRIGLHPNDIMSGYKIAADAAEKIAQELVVDRVEDIRDRKEVAKAMVSAVSSKFSGYENVLSPLVADACISVCPKDPKKFNVDNVRVAKIPGGGISDTTVINGFAVVRNTSGSIKHVKNAKIAVFGCSVDASSTDTKGTVMIKSAADLKSYNLSEEKSMEKEIKDLADAGINVVVTQGSFGEMALHFLERYKIMAVKIPSKFQTRRLCRAVGAAQLVRLGAPTAEEIGSCEAVDVTEIGDQKVIVFRNVENETSGIATVVVRGATTNVLDEVERAIDDAVNVYKSMAKDNRLVAGAGAFELELFQRLTTVADETPGLEQYAIRKFAESFLVVPRTLCESAGHSSTDSIATLSAAHQEGKATWGVDVESPSGMDAVANGILDSFATKFWAIRLASSAAIDILGIDSIIMARPAGGPKPPKQGGHWDDQD